MSFVSIKFIGFVLISLFLYYIMPMKKRWISLLLMSTVFYLIGGGKTIIYLIFTTISTYFAGILLGKYNCCEKSNEAMIKKKKKIVVAITLIANFGILFLFKYLSPLMGIFNNIFNVDEPATLNLILPLGISFYMFQSIGYVIDVYRNKYKPERNIFKFVLFTSFFPQVVQGPISRFDSLSKELFEPHHFSYDNIKDGIILMMWGYFKKLIIADRAAVVVNAVLGDYTNQSGTIILIAMILYCIQLYTDFSGGIDITRGVSKLFGINLIDNFERPIFSTSLTSFWRRWHISLGTWMKDYLFYPLSLSKTFVKFGKFVRKHIKGKVGKILPISLVTFIVYFTIGIWHGGSIKYIVFGIWNGVLITVSLLLEPWFIKIKQKMKIADSNKAFYIFQLIRTSIIVLIGRYITRAPRFLASLYMLKKTFTDVKIGKIFDGTLLNFGISGFDYLVIAVATIILLVVEGIDEYGIGTKKLIEKQKPVVQWLILMLSLFSLLIFGIFRGNYISSEFIYKQF